MHRILPARPIALAVLLACSIPAAASQTRAAEDPHARYVPPSPRAADVVTPAAAARLSRGGTAAL